MPTKAVTLPWPITCVPFITTFVTQIVRQLPFPYRLATANAKKTKSSSKTGQSDRPPKLTPPTTIIVSPFSRNFEVLFIVNRTRNETRTLLVFTFVDATNRTRMTASTHVTGLPSLSLSLSTGWRPRPRPTSRECRTPNMEVELAEDTAVVSNTVATRDTATSIPENLET